MVFTRKSFLLVGYPRGTQRFARMGAQRPSALRSYRFSFNKDKSLNAVQLLTSCSAGRASQPLAQGTAERAIQPLPQGTAEEIFGLVSLETRNKKQEIVTHISTLGIGRWTIKVPIACSYPLYPLHPC